MNFNDYVKARLAREEARGAIIESCELNGTVFIQINRPNQKPEIKLDSEFLKDFERGISA